MSRTKGSGWGNSRGLVWQKCPVCDKKKVLYYPKIGHSANTAKCHYCQNEWREPTIFINQTFQ